MQPENFLTQTEETFRHVIGAKLRSMGVISEQDAARIPELIERTGRSHGAALDRMGVVAECDWLSAVADISGLPILTAKDFPKPLPMDPRLESTTLRSESVAPIHLDDDQSLFAVGDPYNRRTVTALRMVYGRTMKLALASTRDIEAAWQASEIEREEEARSSSRFADLDLDQLIEVANQAPTVKYVDGLLHQAVIRSATDIHLEPQDHGVRVRLRINGVLHDMDPPEPSACAGVISRLKILSELDIAERRLPQDGQIQHRVHGRKVDVRVASAPTVHGEALTLRLLDASANHRSLEGLQMPKTVQEKLERALLQPNGLILITGPTGSGKTTTLHAALQSLKTKESKIITIEDPVEICNADLLQIEVNPELGLTFAAALRSVLRHDPDTLMVGEIRDRETAELAVQASLTGHLVLTTLHTNSAVEALIRLENLGLQRHTISSVLRFAAAQRLVRTLCTACACRLDELELEKLLELLQEVAERMPAEGRPDFWRLKGPVGCQACDHTGFSGRIALFDTIESQDVSLFFQGCGQTLNGMIPAGLQLIASGRTTLDELVRVLGAPQHWLGAS